MTATLSLCFSFHFTPMPHALLTLVISVQCMAMYFFPSLPFCHRHAVVSCFTSFPFHGYAWCMPLNTCCHILSLCWDLLVRYKHVHTMSFQYIRPQVPPRELQSSSLGFPHSQPEGSPPQPTASAFSASVSVFDSLECQLTLSPLGCFTDPPCVAWFYWSGPTVVLCG